MNEHEGTAPPDKTRIETQTAVGNQNGVGVAAPEKKQERPETPRKRSAVTRVKGKVCIPGKPEIISFTVDRDFYPERLVLHHLCVRGLLIDDIRVRKPGQSVAESETRLQGEGELIGEAFIASIPENHTPDLGLIEKGGGIDLHVRNIAPNSVVVHGHILGFLPGST